MKNNYQRYIYPNIRRDMVTKPYSKGVETMDVAATMREGRAWIHDYMIEYDNDKYYKDVNYLKGHYFPMSQEILKHVQDECDKHEYEGSHMFDEYPDKVALDKMIDNIAVKVTHLGNMYRPVLEEDDGVAASSHCMSCRGQEDWLKNLISVILFNEMHHRRRRYYKRRKRFY